MKQLLFAACMASFAATSCTDQKVQDAAKKQPTFLENVFNGAFAGSVEVIVNNPAIVLTNSLILRASTTKEHSSWKKYFFHDWQSLGTFLKRYYKGCGTGIASMAPITAVQNGAALALAGLYGEDPTLNEKAIAALTAGMFSSALSSPADLIVLQRQNPLYTSEPFSGTLTRIAAGGYSRLYRGVACTGVRDGLFTAAFKTGGDLFQHYVALKTGNVSVDRMLTNSLVAVMAAVVSHPAHVLSALMKGDLSKEKYHTTWQTAYELFHREGAQAYMKGVTPRTWRILLAVPLLNALTANETGMRMAKKLAFFKEKEEE